jgi:hypothetical protein
MGNAEIAYIDESYDQSHFAMSALIIPMHTWRRNFEHLQSYRKHLKASLGIFTSKEFHATDFVSGRGRIAPNVISKWDRCNVFKESMGVFSSLDGAEIISGIWLRNGRSLNAIHVHAFSRIQERLQRRSVAQNSQMIVVADEGKEKELRKVARLSKVWNPVGSQFGQWSDGSSYKNIPNDRLLEDPFFKPSDQSYFLQAADFIAFALLKSEVAATAHVSRYGLNAAYDLLEPICVKKASAKDPRKLGIVRS